MKREPCGSKVTITGFSVAVERVLKRSLDSTVKYVYNMPWDNFFN